MEEELVPLLVAELLERLAELWLADKPRWKVRQIEAQLVCKNGVCKS